MVRAIAQDFRRQQEPEIVQNAPDAYDVMLIGSIGRERFQISQDKCAWRSCRLEADQGAAQARTAMSATAAASMDARPAEAGAARDRAARSPGFRTIRSTCQPEQCGPSVSECDQLAASETRLGASAGSPRRTVRQDGRRRGNRRVRVKAVKANPRVTPLPVQSRPRLSQARNRPGARHAAAATCALRSACLAYEDATRARLRQRAQQPRRACTRSATGWRRNDRWRSTCSSAAPSRGTRWRCTISASAIATASGCGATGRQAFELFAKAGGNRLRRPRWSSIGDALAERPRRDKTRAAASNGLQRAAEAGSARAKYSCSVSRIIRGRLARPRSSDHHRAWRTQTHGAALASGGWAKRSEQGQAQWSVLRR